MMRRLALPVLSLSSLLALSLPASARAEDDFRRLAIVIGANDGGDERVRLRYAGTDAEAFSDVLTELGGVDPDDLWLLQEPDADVIRRTLDQVAHEARRTRRRGDRVEVLLYYSGHADAEGLLPGGDHLPYDDLRGLVRSIDSDVRVSVLDSCASGALIRTKGGVRRPGFLAGASQDVEGEAYLTSSTADEASQESDTVQASYFTYHLVTGLRGAADADGDLQITLSEAYTYAFRETLRSTERTLAGPQHPNYAIDLRGQGDFIVTDLRAATSSLVVDAGVDGLLWVRDDQQRLLAEVDKVTGADLTLSLPPGEYELTLQTRPVPYTTRVSVPTNGYQRISTGDFAAVVGPMQPTTLRGDSEVAAPVPAAPDPTGGPTATFGFQVVHGVGTSPDTAIRGVAFDLIQGTYRSIDGAQIGLAAAASRTHVKGLQMTLGANWAGTSLQGTQFTAGFNQAGSLDRAIQFSAGFNSATDADTPHTGAQITVGGNYAGADFHGVQASTGFNLARGRLQGTQVTAGANIAAGPGPSNHKGAQLSAGLNHVTGTLRGAQLTVGMNIATRHVSGAQAAVGVNVVGGELQGAQLGTVNIANLASGAQVGVINTARSIQGAQVGIVNTTGRSPATQVGLVNVATELQGEAVGLLSFIGNGYHAVEFHTGDIAPLATTFKFGSRHLYTALNLGWDPTLQRGLSYGLGMGAHWQLGRVSLDSDLMVHNEKVDDISDTQGLVASWRAQVGVRVVGPLHLFAGPSLDTAISWTGDPLSKQTYMPVWLYRDGTTVGWVGFDAGLRLTF